MHDIVLSFVGFFFFFPHIFILTLCLSFSLSFHFFIHSFLEQASTERYNDFDEIFFFNSITSDRFGIQQRGDFYVQDAEISCNHSLGVREGSSVCLLFSFGSFGISRIIIIFFMFVPSSVDITFICMHLKKSIHPFSFYRPTTAMFARMGDIKKLAGPSALQMGETAVGRVSGRIPKEYLTSSRLTVHRNPNLVFGRAWTFFSLIVHYQFRNRSSVELILCSRVQPSYFFISGGGGRLRCCIASDNCVKSIHASLDRVQQPASTSSSRRSSSKQRAFISQSVKKGRKGITSSHQ